MNQADGKTVLHLSNRNGIRWWFLHSRQASVCLVTNSIVTGWKLIAAHLIRWAVSGMPGAKGHQGSMWLEKPFAFQLFCSKSSYCPFWNSLLGKSADTTMHNHTFIPAVWKQANLFQVIVTISSDNTRWHQHAEGVSADTAKAIKFISSKDASEAAERAATHQESNLLLSSPSFHHLPPLHWLVTFV